MLLKLFINLSRTPLYIPKLLRTSRRCRDFRTSLGSDKGFLFFLESCCSLLKNIPTFIHYDDNDFVEFCRIDLERCFDLFISLTTSYNCMLTFTNIRRTEFGVIFSKNVFVFNANHLMSISLRVRFDIIGDDDASESEGEYFDLNAKNAPKLKVVVDKEAYEEV